VVIALLAIVLITWLNLRGVRESGTIFAIPTYAFIAGVLLTIVVGLVRYFGIFGATPILQTPEVVAPSISLTGFAYVWLLLRAFSGGCTALTGIEAISNGVKAFKCPEPRNAAKTMVAMGIVAMTLFVGILFLSTHLTLIPNESESILSQLTRKATGTGFVYYWVQIFTAGILFMAANTGYQDFPRLSYFLAQDNYLPRWLKNRGDRLVFSAGIVTLAVVSSLLILIFQADEIAMLPLYAIGVMLCFSLSQAGMFRLMGRIAHLKKGETLETKVTVVHYEKGVKWKRVMNAIGSIVTFSVFLILLLTKFLEGAWIVALLIPILVYTFYSIKRHYANVSKTLSTRALEPTNLIGVANVVIVPIADIHMGSLRAIQYAKLLSNDVRVITISTGVDDKQQFLQHWNRFPNVIEGTKLELIDYDYRDVLTPIVNYIKRVNRIEFPHEITTVVIPEFIPERVLARLLHNQTATRLRSLLRNYRDIVIIEVPFHIDS
jgi:amino acid transporter